MSNKPTENLHSLRELKTYHVGALEASSHRALRQYKDTILRKFGITGIEWYVIGNIYDSGPKGIRITELSKELGTTMGFMTKTVNILEAKKILFRKANASDARSNYVVMNSQYRSICEEIEENLRNELRKSIYSLVSPEELATYIKVIDKFSNIS